MNHPWWLLALWTATGLCAGWVVGAAGTWAGFSAGPASGGVVAVALIWGALYWAAGRSGRVLGAVLASAASGGAAAALAIAACAPVLTAWGESWIYSPLLLRLAFAGLGGVTLGRALTVRAGDPGLTFPDAAVLAQTIAGPAEGRRWLVFILGAVAGGIVRWGVAAGWWPGLVAAGEGPGLPSLAGLAVSPALLGLGLLLGWERSAGVGAGSLGITLIVLPAALAFGPLATAAPGLAAAGRTAGLDLHATYGPLTALGAVAVALAGSAVSRLRTGTGKTWGGSLWLRSPRGALMAAVLLSALAFWRLGGAPAWPGWMICFLLAGAALAACAAGLTLVAHLGTQPLMVLGAPALAVSAPALAVGLAGRLFPAATAGQTPELAVTAGVLALTIALFAADYLQSQRMNLLLEVRFPLYPLKLAACLAGLAGACLAASAWAAAPYSAGAAESPAAGLLSRIALAGPSGLLSWNLPLAGAGLAALTWLLGRPLWPVALGVLLPLPGALTLLLGAWERRRWEEGVRFAGLGLMAGDLAAQGGALFLAAWRFLPEGGRWAGLGPAAEGLGPRLSGLAVVAALSLLVWFAGRRYSGYAGPEKLAASAQEAAGNAAFPG